MKLISKTCSICKRQHAIEEFSKNKESKDGRLNQCKTCCKIRARELYYKDHQETRRKRNEYKRLHPGNPVLVKKWAMTAQQKAVEKNWQTALEKLGRKCACCQTTEESFLRICLINGSISHVTRSDNAAQQFKNEGYPENRYILYCFNCSKSISILGRCAHKTHFGINGGE